MLFTYLYVHSHSDVENWLIGALSSWRFLPIKVLVLCCCTTAFSLENSRTETRPRGNFVSEIKKSKNGHLNSHPLE